MKLKLSSFRAKKALRLLAFSVLVTNSVTAQNKAWAMPNNTGTQGYYDWVDGQTKPFQTTDPITCETYTTPVNSGYTPSAHNQHTASANAITNDDGDLLFFIVGSSIFDALGRTIHFDGGYDVSHGISEISVVPNPGDCNQYFIFTNSGNQAVYLILDLSLTGNTSFSSNYNSQGKIVPNPNGDAFFVLPNSGVAGNGKPINVMYAVTNDDNSNEYNVFMLNGNGAGVALHNYTINSAGVNFMNTFNLNVFPYSGYHTVISKRSELEVFEQANGNYKICYAGQEEIQEFIVSSNLSILLQHNHKRYYPPNGTTTLLDVAGLEYSPNGRYIYFTHEPHTQLPDVINCWDKQLNNILALPGASTVNSEYQFSYIESQNGKLYMPIYNDISEIINPNSPTSITINDGFIPLNYVPNNYDVNNYIFNQKRYTLPDQIDTRDYDGLYEEMDEQCCIDSRGYDKEIFTASDNVLCDPNFTSTTQIWTPSNNPLNNGGGNPIYIKEAINIPAGYTVTMDGLEIYFHPDAEINVSRGSGSLNGGRLNVRNSKLTVDNRCSDDLFWKGIDVEGHYNEPQGFYFNSKQGFLRVYGNSTVEFSEVGAHAGQYINGIYQATYSGGVIKATGSTWRNNWIDIRLEHYTPNNNVTNECSAYSNTFITDEVFFNGPKYVIHIYLFDVKKVNIKGNDFINAVPLLYLENRRGFGVLSYNSNFTVNRAQVSANPNVPQVPNTFTNLTHGVYASTGNQLINAKVEKNIFINNQYGVTYRGMAAGMITENYFEVAESSLSQKTTGIYLNNCTAYKVEGNNLQSNQNTNSNANSYGIVVNNSGEADNFIYRNTFKDLKVGGQSQRINAPAESPDNSNIGHGLKWQCNDFQTNITTSDLAITSGRIDYLQGTVASNLIAPEFAGARNLFSHDAPVSANQFDIFMNTVPNIVDYGILYSCYPNTQSTVPQNGNYTANYGVYPAVQVVNAVSPVSNYYYNHNLSCPNKIKVIGDPLEIAQLPSLAVEIGEHQVIIDNSNQQAMSDAIGTMNNEQLKNVLLSNSPMISDAVMIEYIMSNPPSNFLIEVLSENELLSSSVLNVLNDNNVLNAYWLNIFNSDFNGISPYNQVLYAMSHLNNVKNDIIDDAIRYYMLVDSTLVNPIDSVISLLETEDNKYRKQQLVDAYMYKKSLGLATSKNDEIKVEYGIDNFSKLADERIAKTYGICVIENITCDANSKLAVENISTDDTDENLKLKSKCYLVNYFDIDNHENVIEDLIIDGQVKDQSSNGVAYEEVVYEEGNKFASEFEMKIYPNPTSSNFNIEINGLDEAENSIMEVVNIEGKVVYSNPAKNIIAIIEVAKLPKGMYFVLVRIETKLLKLEKLVIE